MVSYNRPFINRQGFLNDQFFNSEYPMVRWLERNGYNVSYFSGVDTDRRDDEIREHKILLSAGHDAFWSGAQRRNIEAARDAGVNLAFFSSSAGFWRSRYEASNDRRQTPYRTLVPIRRRTQTARSIPKGRSDRYVARLTDIQSIGSKAGERCHRNAHTVGGFRNDRLAVPARYGRLRFWRNTEVVHRKKEKQRCSEKGCWGTS